MQENIQTTKAACDTARKLEEDAKTAIAASAAVSTPAPSAQRSRRTNSRQDYGALAGRSAARPVNLELLNNLNSAKMAVVQADMAHGDACTALADFMSQNRTSETEFKERGKNTAHPMIEHYKKNFILPGGDYAIIGRAYMAARVCNPLAAARMGKLEVVDAVHDLHLFGFDEFRAGNGILPHVEEEIPLFLANIASTPASFWSEVSRVFQTESLFWNRNDNQVSIGFRLREQRSTIGSSARGRRQILQNMEAKHGRMIALRRLVECGNGGV